MAAFLSAYSKKLPGVLFALCVLSSAQTRCFGQVDTGYVRNPFGWIINAGESELLTLRPELDAWTLTNYKVTEVQWPHFYAAGSLFYDRFKLGLDFNFGSAFQYQSVDAGFQVTGQDSRIASWLEFDYGEMYGEFSNIRPLKYQPTPAQAGQNLVLAYQQPYIGITSITYPNFLHFKLENQDSDPTFFAHSFYIGFFFSVCYLPGRQYCQYGYADKGNFQAVNIYNIPTLNPWEITAGIFIGISGRVR